MFGRLEPNLPRFELYQKNSNVLISLSDFKSFINQPSLASSYDIEWQSFLDQAISIIESYLGYPILINKYDIYLKGFFHIISSISYSNIIQFNGQFGNCQSIDSISYTKTNDFDTIIDPSLYTLQKKSLFESYITTIISLNQNGFPNDFNLYYTNTEVPKECVKIRANFGLADNASIIDARIFSILKNTILNIASDLYETKGLCDGGQCDNSFFSKRLSIIPRELIAKPLFV